MGLPYAGGSRVLPAELIYLADLDLKLCFKILEINNLAQMNLAKLLTSKIYQMLKHLNPSRVTANCSPEISPPCTISTYIPKFTV